MINIIDHSVRPNCIKLTDKMLCRLSYYVYFFLSFCSWVFDTGYETFIFWVRGIRQWLWLNFVKYCTGDRGFMICLLIVISVVSFKDLCFPIRRNSCYLSQRCLMFNVASSWLSLGSKQGFYLLVLKTQQCSYLLTYIFSVVTIN